MRNTFISPDTSALPASFSCLGQAQVPLCVCLSSWSRAVTWLGVFRTFKAQEVGAHREGHDGETKAGVLGHPRGQCLKVLFQDWGDRSTGKALAFQTKGP